LSISEGVAQTKRIGDFQDNNDGLNEEKLDFLKLVSIFRSLVLGLSALSPTDILPIVRAFVLSGDNFNVELASKLIAPRTDNVIWGEGGFMIDFAQATEVSDYLKFLDEAIGSMVELLEYYFLELSRLTAAEKRLSVFRFGAFVLLVTVLLHPFGDGNKRTSHVLAWVLMSRFLPDLVDAYVPSEPLYVNELNLLKSLSPEAVFIFLSSEENLRWIFFLIVGRVDQVANDERTLLHRFVTSQIYYFGDIIARRMGAEG